MTETVTGSVKEDMNARYALPTTALSVSGYKGMISEVPPGIAVVSGGFRQASNPTPCFAKVFYFGDKSNGKENFPRKIVFFAEKRNMRITVITENRPSPDGRFRSEHGLALLFEWNGRPWLFDTGASAAVLDNLRVAGTDPSELYGIVLSHAHDDHAGGVEALLEANPQVRVWLSREAFGRRCFSLRTGRLRDISMDGTLPDRYPGRFVPVAGSGELEPGMRVLTAAEVSADCCLPDARLLTECGGERMPDDFQHEISLVLADGDRTVLLAGCAHRGLRNIVEACRKVTGRWPDAVAGGCHLPDGAESTERRAEELARYLSELPTRPFLFTGHCTGERAAAVLKERMGERMALMRCGMKREV